MNVICVDPRYDPRWQELLEKTNSTIFHSSAWIQTLADTYAFEFEAYLLLNDAGKPEAGIPLCRLSDWRGDRVQVLPFSDYCDPLVQNQQQWDTLRNHIVSEGYPVSIRCLHNNIPLEDSCFSLTNKAKWHGLNLDPNVEHLFQALPPKTRRGINKAERDGVKIKIAEYEDELRRFFELHLRLRKYKYRLLAQPYLLFQNLWHYIIEKKLGVLLQAVYQDEVIGGAIFLKWNRTLFYKYSATSPAHKTLRAADYILWEGIKYGKLQGCTYCDFGLTDWDQESLIEFKRKFATEEKTISFLHHIPSIAEMPSKPSLNPQMLPQLTELFTDESVPDSITEKAGEILYRYFT